jgi:UDP-N-acetyl-2-amino-2-deoxyglucuronate dehydrogenase
MFRIGLIGCGAVADMHWTTGYLALRARAPELLRLVAACDTRPDRLEPFVERARAAMAQGHGSSAKGRGVGVAAYARYEDLLADPEIDGVDLCVPHRAHAPMALQALAAGKHVLVEKPIADTVAGADQMVAAAQRAGLTLCVNENYPFSEPFRRARQLVNDGRLGRLCIVRSHRVMYLDGIWLRDGWRQNADQAGGGILLDQGCHYTNILRWLVRDVAGEITHVHAYSAAVREGFRGEDTATLNLRFAGGLIGAGFYCWSTKTPGRGAEAYVYGEEGSLEVGSDSPALTLFRRDLPSGAEVVHDRPDYGETFARSLEDFALAALGQRPPTMPGADGLADLRVVEAAYRSIRSRREEAV